MLNMAEIIGGSGASGVLAFIGGLGPWEIAIIVIVVLLLFGGKKIPELAKGIGRGMREFKKEIHGVKEDFEKAIDEDDQDDYSPPRRRRKKRRKPQPEAVDEEDAGETGEDKPAETAPAAEDETQKQKAETPS